ncbi:MAG: DUF1648 domain-containing protein, partial [Methanomicrobiales archaeon]|nr:DUF1648 domain-containing protein [Methanomicrobiales archaeon]
MEALSERLKKMAGWCPMAAAAQKGNQHPRAVVPQAKAADAGPADGRAVVFSYLTFAMAGISWLVALAALPYLPDQIPIHWNLYGEPDGFSGRFTGAFGLPAIITLIAILLIVLPRFDRMKDTFNDSRDIYAIVTFATICLLFGIELLTFLSTLGFFIPMAIIFPVLLGFFFIVMGGMMPHVRRNTTIGFRLPWTIRSDPVWVETHRRGGPIMAAAGILIVLESTVAGVWAMPLAFGIIMVTFGYIIIWSWHFSRSEAACGG